MVDYVSLSHVRPDFEGINQQLQAALSAKASWINLSTSSTCEILLEAISMVGEYSQFSIMSALHETTLENAHLPESIYTNCRFLSVRLSRKIPAQVSVTLQNNDLSNPFLEIPAYTQFSIEGEKYFNRTSIIFNANNLIINTTLYQGELKYANFLSSGTTYQTYVLEENTPWSISNEDIVCEVNNTLYERSTKPIFLFENGETKFYENSLPNGNVECKFGNGTYGAIPNANSEILFIYAVTKGFDGNNSNSQLRVTCSNYPSLVGETTSNSYGGAEEPELEYYKQLGAQEGASNDRGIIREDFKSLVVKYPGIIDCNVYGQAEIAPLDKDWMNVVGLMILTDSSFTEASWKNMVSYLKSKSIFGLQFKRFDPEPVNVDIVLTLYMLPSADLTNSKKIVIEALENYTKLKLGSLGRSLYASDIEDVIFSVLPTEIDYIDKKTPQINYVINKNQYINITNLEISVAYSTRDSQTWTNSISS